MMDTGVKCSRTLVEANEHLRVASSDSVRKIFLLFSPHDNFYPPTFYEGTGEPGSTMQV